jgi:hypothetical protein
MSQGAKKLEGESENVFENFKKLSEKISKFSKLGGVNDFLKNFYQFFTKFLKLTTKKDKIFQDSRGPTLPSTPSPLRSRHPCLSRSVMVLL